MQRAVSVAWLGLVVALSNDLELLTDESKDVALLPHRRHDDAAAGDVLEAGEVARQAAQLLDGCLEALEAVGDWRTSGNSAQGLHDFS